MNDVKGLNDVKVFNIILLTYYEIKTKENCRRNSLYFLLIHVHQFYIK